MKFAALNAPDATVLRGTCGSAAPADPGLVERAGGDARRVRQSTAVGLESEVTASLAEELRPGRIAYLSCSAGSLARDLESFEAAGYSLERILPYDFFPLTHHVEALALLECR